MKVHCFLSQKHLWLCGGGLKTAFRPKFRDMKEEENIIDQLQNILIFQ